MPSLDLLIFPLLAGYVFLTTFNGTKFYHQRIERQRLIFNSAICGFFLSLAGLYFDEILKLPRFINFRETLGKAVPVEYDGLNLVLLIFLLSWPLSKILNLILNDKWLLNRTIQSRGDEYEKLFWKSLQAKKDEDKLLMITTDTDKVYVGYVMKITRPIGNPHIVVLPYISGFRDKDTRQFIITTDYFMVLEDLISQDMSEIIGEKMGLIIPKDDIKMVSRFDFDVFERFLDTEEVINEADTKSQYNFVYSEKRRGKKD